MLFLVILFIQTRDRNHEVSSKTLNIKIVAYTLLNKAGRGIFLKDSNNRLFYRLPDYFIVFQAQVMAILKAISTSG